MVIATWLVSRKKWGLTALRGHISQAFAETTVAKLSGTSEEFDGIIGAEGRNARLHCAVVLITKGQDVGAHGPSLAFARMSYQPGAPIKP